VLEMSAGELGYPVPLVVLVETGDRLPHGGKTSFLDDQHEVGEK
jgi:hypothetical protein